MERLPYPQILKLVEDGDCDAVFRLAADRLNASIGYRLFTLLVPDMSGNRLRRIFTTDAEAYPLGPADEFRKSPWFDQLFGKCQPIIASNSAAIENWLPGFEGFVGTDLESLINYPLVVADETVGLVNLMDTSGSYGDETARLLDKEMLLPAIAIAAHLASRRQR